MGWGKKGITPLMITFLLISLAVAVGVGVMNFGRAQVEEKAECALDIGLHFLSIGGKQQVCYDSATKKVSFTVENGINIDIQGLIVNIIGAQKAETVELSDAVMAKAGSYVAQISYDPTTSGEIRQLKITPKIVPAGQEIICIEQALVLEALDNC